MSTPFPWKMSCDERWEIRKDGKVLFYVYPMHPSHERELANEDAYKLRKLIEQAKEIE